jgi:hypothetical protein
MDRAPVSLSRLFASTGGADLAGFPKLLYAVSNLCGGNVNTTGHHD